MTEEKISFRFVIFLVISMISIASISMYFGIQRGQDNQREIDGQMIQNVLMEKISLKDHITLILDKRVIDIINETLIADYPNETGLCLHGYKNSISNHYINQTSYRIIFARKANILRQNETSISLKCITGTLMKMHTHPINEYNVEYCSPSTYDMARVQNQIEAVACGTNRTMTDLVFYNNLGNMINDYEMINGKFVYYGNVIRIK